MAGLDMPMEEEDGCPGEIVPDPRMRGYTPVAGRDEGSGISVAAHRVVIPDGSAYPFFCSLSLWDARYGRPTAAFSVLGAVITDGVQISALNNMNAIYAEPVVIASSITRFARGSKCQKR